MDYSDSDPGETSAIEVREVDEARSEIKKISSEVLDTIAVEGEVSEPGPSVAECSNKDPEKYFKMHHGWSVSGASKSALSQAMKRLKKQLPENGWEITDYGPNDSPDRTLEMTADHLKKKHGVNVQFWENRASDGEPMLVVNVVSACYKVPAGLTVDRY